MPSTLTTTELANLALSKLGPGGGYLTAFDTDTSVQGQAARRTYAAIRDEVMEAHAWRFARRRAAIAADVAVPAWGFATQFTLPTDCLRVLSVEGTGVKYEQENGLLLTDEAGPLNIRYLAQITDTSKFSPTFIAAMTTRWAIEMCPTITKSNTQRSDLWAEYRGLLAQARKTDTFGSVPEAAKDGSWNDSRL